MELKNYMEILVFDAIDELFKTNQKICNCEKCRLDIAAKALSILPTKYTVNYKGEVFTKANLFQNQSNADIVSAVTKAIMLISQNPRHI
jgi:competence protein ComFB